MRGLSRAKLCYMRAVAETYPDEQNQERQVLSRGFDCPIYKSAWDCGKVPMTTSSAIGYTGMMPAVTGF
jgi:hypothetical protein